MPQSVPRRRRPSPSRALSLLLLVAGVLLTTVGTAPASVAHASLVSSSPADGATVLSPHEVVLTFDDVVGADAAIVVTGPGGATVGGAAQVTGSVVSAPVSISAPGSYSVAFRVVSDDGHPVSGQLAFQVTDDQDDVRGHGSASAPAGGSAGASGGTSRVLAVVAGLAVLLGVGLLTVRRWAPDLWTNRR